MAVFVAVAGGASLVALQGEGFGALFRMLELRAYDVRDELIHGPPQATGHVLIVEADEASMSALGRWPFDRNEMARVVRNLAAADARVIALQLDLRDKTGVAADTALHDAVSGCRERVVLSRGFGVDRQWQPLACDLAPLVSDLERGDGMGPPIAMAEVDGHRRRVPLAWFDPPATPFCVVVAGRMTGTRPRVELAGAVLIGNRFVPYSYDGTIVVRTPRYREQGQVVSFVDVAQGRVPAERIRGRIVLVTPPHNPMVDPYEPPGFVQAAAIEQVLWGRPVTHAPPVVAALATALVVAAMLLVFYRQGWWPSLPAVTLFLAIYAALTVYLLWHDRIWVDVVLPLVAGMACIAAVGLAEGALVRSLFAQLFPSEVGERMLHAGDAAQVQQVVATVRDMATSLDVDALLDRLVECLEVIAPHTWHDVAVLHPGTGAWSAERRRGPVPETPPENALVVEMVVEQSRVGTIVLGSPHGFTDWQRDLVSTLGLQAASLLRNAQLYAEVVEAHRALAESRALLDQSSRLAAVGQLAAGVAHEINNPLGAVFLDLDGALRNLEKQPDRTRQKLERARGALTRVKGIVAQLLDFSRDHGATEEVGLDEVVREALSLLTGAVRDVSLETDLQAVPVRVHRSHIGQVLTNLLLNAVKAVEASADRRITVVTRDDGRHAVLEVSDSGEGMSEEVKARIFEPFYTTRPVGQGTGLGLWVTQRIVAQEGGTIEVESRPGGPTVFQVRLPRGQADAGAN